MSAVSKEIVLAVEFHVPTRSPLLDGMLYAVIEAVMQ